MEIPKLQLTSQRKAVLSAVQSHHGHLDASQVFEKVREQMPRISLGTVYRSLGALRDAGMLHEIETGNGPALYDGNLTPHQHVTCRSCGKVEDVEISLPDEIITRAAVQSGFENVEATRIRFHGICRDCAAR